MDDFQDSSEKLAGKISPIFIEKGITDESIAEVQDILVNDYLDCLPEELRGEYEPVLGIIGDRLAIGWKKRLSSIRFLPSEQAFII